jgi:hypothetical protein
MYTSKLCTAAILLLPSFFETETKKYKKACKTGGHALMKEKYCIIIFVSLSFNHNWKGNNIFKGHIPSSRV